jgi:hypothetical protein
LQKRLVLLTIRLILIIMRKQIKEHIERNVMMSCLQSGFQTQHNNVTKDLLMTIENKLLSIIILLDFSKAFDSVAHSLMCTKLANLLYMYSPKDWTLIFFLNFHSKLIFSYSTTNYGFWSDCIYFYLGISMIQGQKILYIWTYSTPFSTRVHDFISIFYWLVSQT